MSDASKYSFPKAENVQVFEHVQTYNEHNYAADDARKQQIQDLSTLVSTLQATH